eukprot:gene4604-11622_t
MNEWTKARGPDAADAQFAAASKVSRQVALRLHAERKRLANGKVV